MPKGSRNEIFLIIITGVFLALSVLSLWFLWRNTFLCALILFILAVFEMIIIKSKRVIAMYFLCAIGGGFVEAIAIYFGNWRYSLPTFFNIPLWLLPAWGSAGIFIICFYKLLSKFKWLEKKTEQTRIE